MFFHRQELQLMSEPDQPDAVYARKLQEVLGGQYGEITVAMQYMFQAWNIHIPGKYRDLLFGIGAEEIGHVEMLATMIAQLLEKAPLGITSDAVQEDPTVAAVVGGMDVQHAIVAGAGAPVPWTATATRGRARTSPQAVTSSPTSPPTPAQMQGRLQVARLYHQGTSGYRRAAWCTSRTPAPSSSRPDHRRPARLRQMTRTPGKPGGCSKGRLRTDSLAEAWVARIGEHAPVVEGGGVV
jgi:hypothetical protein